MGGGGGEEVYGCIYGSEHDQIVVRIHVRRRMEEEERTHPFEVDISKSGVGACEDIRTAAHSPKGDKAYPRLHCVEDKRLSNAVRHIPIGWGDERGVTRHWLSLLTTPTKRNEHPPQPSTIGHEDPPPGSTVDDEGPLTSTKPTTRIDERLRGPITTIDEKMKVVL